jgi:hypothetical protein
MCSNRHCLAGRVSLPLCGFNDEAIGEVRTCAQVRPHGMRPAYDQLGYAVATHSCIV